MPSLFDDFLLDFLNIEINSFKPNPILFSIFLIIFICFTTGLTRKYFEKPHKATQNIPEPANEQEDKVELEVEENFFDAQIEKQKLIEEKLACVGQVEEVTMPKLKLELTTEVELSLEEKEKELELKKNQLDYLFRLVKAQETTECGEKANNFDFETIYKDSDCHDFKFSILKTDGTYEQKEIELKNVFESQLRLYGL